MNFFAKENRSIIGWWAVFLLVAYFILLRATSYMADGWDNGCAKKLLATIELAIGTEVTVARQFNTKNRCFDTGIHMQAGERYLVSIDTRGLVQWKDASIPSSPEGFDNHMTNYHPVMIAAMPMRRHLKDAWFVVMGKIGRNGTTFRVGKKKKVTATETGRLYLYVNDAPIFYDNNYGTGQVTVERLAE